MADLRIYFEEPEFTIGSVENCLVWAFRTAVTLERIKWGQRVHADLKKDYPKFAVMTIVGENISLSMPQDSRDLSTAITKEYQPYYCGICEVIEGKGFGASVARSVVAGVRLMARSSAPARVFSEVTTASSWLGALMSPAEPERAVKSLNAAALRMRVPK
ncbi:hypothetical protein BH09MYX1_BH09MYX1_59840 [soil metagenome]